MSGKQLRLLGVPATIEYWASQTGSQKIKIGLGNYIPKVVNEIKEMEGSKFEGANLWTVKDSPRNHFTIDILSNGEYNGSSKLYSTSTTVVCNSTRPLWDHQRKSFMFKVRGRRIIDAGEMGIGKTLSTIEALEYFRNVLEWSGVIWIIAPNSALTAWRTQCLKWNFHLKHGDKLQNYHSLEKLMEEADVPPQMIVFDEFHALKNPSARRTQLAIQLTELQEKYYGNDCAVIGLTGTPAPENYFDWWAPCEVVRPGWLREASFSKYKYRIASFGTGERADGGSYPKFEAWRGHPNTINDKGVSVPTPGDCKNPRCEVCSILPQRLEGLILVTWKRDCMDLPEKVYEEIILPPDASTLRVAKAITRMGGKAIEIQSKLRQLSDGFQYVKSPDLDATQESKENYSRIVEGNTPKDQALRDILQEHQENCPKRLVVYAAFTASIDRCAKIIQEEGWNVWQYDGRGQSFHCGHTRPGCEELSKERIRGMDSTNAERIFQDASNYPMPIAFLGNPEAAGQGLTLTPSPTIVYFSNSFKSQFRVQSEDRIHRPGASKQRGCKIIDLIHLPTDRLVLTKIKAKRDAETATLEEIESALET